MSFVANYVVLFYITLFGSLQSLIDATTIPHEESIQNRRDDYTYTPGVGAHKIYTQTMSWNAARRTCQQDGAYLGIINSVVEAQAVVKLFDKFHRWGVWVGVHDLYQEDEFVTIHNEPLAETGFNKWQPGEPNDHVKKQNCVILTSAGVYIDGNCATLEKFVCELPDA